MKDMGLFSAMLAPPHLQLYTQVITTEKGIPTAPVFLVHWRHGIQGLKLCTMSVTEVRIPSCTAATIMSHSTQPLRTHLSFRSYCIATSVAHTYVLRHTPLSTYIHMHLLC